MLGLSVCVVIDVVYTSAYTHKHASTSRASPPPRACWPPDPTTLGISRRSGSAAWGSAPHSGPRGSSSSRAASCTALPPSGRAAPKGTPSRSKGPSSGACGCICWHGEVHHPLIIPPTLAGRPLDDELLPFCFAVSTLSKEMVLAADSAEGRRHWLEQLR